MQLSLHSFLETNVSCCNWLKPTFTGNYLQWDFIQYIVHQRAVSGLINHLSSFSELHNGLSSTEELCLYPENGYATYSHGELSHWTKHMTAGPLISELCWLDNILSSEGRRITDGGTNLLVNLDQELWPRWYQFVSKVFALWYIRLKKTNTIFIF